MFCPAISGHLISITQSIKMVYTFNSIEEVIRQNFKEFPKLSVRFNDRTHCSD